MSTCWQIRCCPASLYNICNAYQNKKNCWEWGKEKPCCKRMDLSRCKDCEVYKVFLATRKKKEKTTICEDCGISFRYKTSKPKRCSKCRKKLSNQKQLAKYYAEKESNKEAENSGNEKSENSSSQGNSTPVAKKSEKKATKPKKTSKKADTEERSSSKKSKKNSKQ